MSEALRYLWLVSAALWGYNWWQARQLKRLYERKLKAIPTRADILRDTVFICAGEPLNVIVIERDGKLYVDLHVDAMFQQERRVH